MLGEPLGLELPPVEAILTATGAKRSRAYELATKLLEAVPNLTRPVGRPRAPAAPERAAGDAVGLSQSVLRFVMTHPGCVHGHGERQRYGDAFRRLVVGLRAEHEELSLEEFAVAVQVPLGTLRAWLSAPLPSEAESATVETAAETAREEGTSSGEPRTPNLTTAHIETVLGAYAGWCGGFVAFCEHVQQELRIGWGRDTIAQVLELHGARRPQRRPGRSPDERALRGAFQTFFPGAQWVGDGMTVPVGIGGGKTIRFNVELQCDAFSGGFVGLSIRDQEDSAAVIESFRDGIATTGAAPLAELLDNKPSNHTPEVDAVLGDTLRIRSTVQRPQNKAHVEGAFGLFARTAPPLELDLRASARQIAAQVLGLVTTTWARAMNQRPRRDRGGLSRAELYGIEPTDEQIAAARAAFEERRRRQELARQTLEARERPDVRAFLDAAFDRLALLDPERHVRLAISRYPLDAIIPAVAIFETKQRAGTLPEGVDARYLLGIVRNIQEQREGELIAAALLGLRTQARDIALDCLRRERDVLSGAPPHTEDVLAALVDRALLSERALDRVFWLNALADFITRGPAADLHARYCAAARCIHATFRADPRRRHEAVRVLSERVVPLA